MIYALRVKGQGWCFVREGANYDYDDEDHVQGLDGAMTFASREAADAALTFQSHPESLMVEEVDA